MASNNALSNALALASSKTNWTAIVPARAPPPPPPTPVKDIVGCCEKCAVEIVRDSDEHDNAHIIDGGDAADKFRCQRCLVDCPCDECDEDKAQCVLCSKWAVSATMSYDDAVGEHSCCDCDPKGDVLLGEEEYICDCSVCGERIYPCGSIELGDDGDGGGCCKGCEPTPTEEDEEEEKYAICEVCGIDECVDYGDKLCHECYHKDVGASECWCAGMSYDDAVGDRARDALKRWAEKELSQLDPRRCIDCDDDVRTKTFWGCEVCGLNTCEECCENDDGYVMCAGCVREKEEEVKKYKAVLAETLRFEAIMDMMKSGDA